MTDEMEDIPPAFERFESPADIKASRTAEAEATDTDALGEAFDDSPDDIEPAILRGDDEPEEAEPAVEAAAEPAPEKAAPVDEKPSKLKLDDEEVDIEDVKTWRSTHKSAQAFDRVVAEKQKELLGVYEDLTAEDARIKSEKEALAAEKAQLAQYRRYLIKQGIDAGDPLSEEVGGDIDDAPTPKRTADADKPLTRADFERMYKERREQESATEKVQSAQQKLVANFDTYVGDALDTAGIAKTDELVYGLAREALAFRFYTQFKGDPNAVLRMGESEQRAVIERMAREIGTKHRQAREKAKAGLADEMAAGGKRVAATPRIAGTPTPGQAAPSQRKSVAARAAGKSLDEYMASVKADSFRRAAELRNRG